MQKSIANLTSERSIVNMRLRASVSIFKSPFSLTLLCLGAMCCPSAKATPISINNGPAPSITSQVSTSFSALDGVALQGQTLSLDFNFANNNFARLFSITDPSFTILITLQTNGGGVVGFLSGTGSLLDQNGSVFGPPESLGSASGDDGSMSAGWFPLLSESLPRPLDFYGIHAQLELPTNLPFSITGGEFQLLASGLPHDVFGVGPGIPRDIVPDSASTLLLFGLALLALGVFRAVHLRSF